jgi:hypothetical protein
VDTPDKSDKSDLYRREADRLYSMISTLGDDTAQSELLQIARRYEALARHTKVSDARESGDSSDTRKYG